MFSSTFRQVCLKTPVSATSLPTSLRPPWSDGIVPENSRWSVGWASFERLAANDGLDDIQLAPKTGFQKRKSRRRAHFQLCAAQSHQPRRGSRETWPHFVPLTPEHRGRAKNPINRPQRRAGEIRGSRQTNDPVPAHFELKPSQFICARRRASCCHRVGGVVN